MTIHFLGEGANHDLPATEIAKFSERMGLDLRFEWINGQFWLHSDIPDENPIGIVIDQELNRHLTYFKRSSVHKELLAKAIGIKGGHRPKVLDLTAGLLGDTLLFLSMGCEVTAVERHPVVAFLLKSALRNAQHPLLEKLHFLEADAMEILRSSAPLEVLYYDPMYEDASTKGLPRKEMRIFRDIIGRDQDAEAVFHLARSLRPQRLVVKRPRLSTPIVEKAPLEFLGKSTRYDVYFWPK